MKVIQIAASEATTADDTASGTLYALTDDGSVWLMIDPWDKKKATWRKLPDIPRDTLGTEQ